MLGLVFGTAFVALIHPIMSRAVDNCGDDANPDCIYNTITEMNTRLNYLIYNRSCDHNAVFGKLCVIETQHLRNKLVTVAENGSLIYSDYFRNPRWIGRTHRLFTNYYFNAIDNWTARQTDLVPKAWRIAFEAADKREMSALGDALLGLSAHIIHDLAHTLATLGMNYTDGNSARDDYNLVTNIYSDCIDEIVTYIANNFDRNALEIYNPSTKDIVVQYLMVMRNDQWNNAVELINSAHDKIACDAINDRIDSSAVAFAKYLITIFKDNSTDRDSFCRGVHGLG